MKLQEKLLLNKKEGKALLATNFYNYETLTAVLTAAKETDSSLIVQLSESSIHYLGLDMAYKMARAGLAKHEVEGWIHLDHGQNTDLVKACIDIGFDSVMIDASEKPITENVEITKSIVNYAAAKDINVEAELGYIAKLDQQQKMVYTQPDEAKSFVDQTGVNALAIAVGSAHGFYKTTPNLQIDLIGEINAVTNAALVLHGSSGIPADQIQAAVRQGITKINLATEIKNAFMLKLKAHMNATDEIDLRKVFPVATEAAKNLVKEKINVINDASLIKL
ncbi:class II fructose-bisphosphate aldolase [Portibacter lacus]|uniref:Fructose-bisphosphate aldolase n=1 Tax=Portibacter lacus TaxID=1099794 RepID=A0AA37SSZ5_9BACT|nr:class II fructose-bisphosphate aldolase [Portibacter lacus]GLR17583.1 fructose-bisphosphate aldolase [Portibacter lacus]